MILASKLNPTPLDRATKNEYLNQIKTTILGKPKREMDAKQGKTHALKTLQLIEKKEKRKFPLKITCLKINKC